jgi:ABC-type enterochelin transport system substrate-binding protein
MRTWVILAVCLFAVMTACSSTTASQSEAQPPAASLGEDVAPAAPSASEAAPAPSVAAATKCVDDQTRAALDQLTHGVAETDPGRAAIADTFEALTLEVEAAEARDALVAALRAEPPDLATAADSFQTLRALEDFPRC